MAYEAGLEFENPLIEVERKIAELRVRQEKDKEDLKEELGSLERRAEELKREIYANLTPWQRVQVARHPKRPYSLDYIGMIFTDFSELHGDRNFAEDPAIVCGPAKLDGQPVIVLGQQKGHDTKENLARNFGMMNPEGYRKALRIMKLGEKFRRPIVSLIDTPGAYPGIGAEERGQSEAIARNLLEMSRLAAPIVAVVIGEGGSGGALGVGLADRVMMLENAVYSVITPEGCAAILWKDAKNAPEAAQALKITARDLKGLGIIDEIIPEPAGGAHRDPESAAAAVKAAVKRALRELGLLSLEDLLEKRHEKFRAMGRHLEVAG